MSSINTGIGRISQQTVLDRLTASTRRTQDELAQAQNQISTGLRYTRPGDNPAVVSSILGLEQSLAARGRYVLNLEYSLGTLNQIDEVLGQSNDLLLEAKTTALSQIGIGSDQDTRAAQAVVIDSVLESLIELANQQSLDLSLFGGNNGAAPEGVVFEPFLGGVRYLGGSENLQGLTGGNGQTSDLVSNGLAAFGALSSRVKTQVDLQPSATAATRLSTLDGATAEGVNRGDLSVVVNGTEVIVSLADADTLGDVVDRVNDAIDSVAVGAGALAVSADGFTLTGVGGNTVAINDTQTGQTAASLGLGISSTGGVPTVGGDVGVNITKQTTLASLGTAVDFASGLVITQGTVTKNADFTAAVTIEDVLNEVESLDLGVRLEINTDGTGLDVVSEVSGIKLSVGENGGTTATDLGIRTLGNPTSLNEYRDGLGVETLQGSDDFEVRLHDGTTFAVNLDGLNTVGEVVTAVGAAATGAGLTLGVEFDVGFPAVGNGLVLTDNTVGGNDFEVVNLDTSLAATHLGLVFNAGAGATIDSGDQTKVRVESAFTHLQELAAALRNNDEIGITVAGEKMENDLSALTQARAIVGGQARSAQERIDRSLSVQQVEQTLLSEVQDADLTEVISRFTLLQQQLQATLQTGARSFQLSLLDFLR